MQKTKYLSIESRRVGLFSNVLHTIDQLIYCEKNNIYPIIDWGRVEGSFLYKDEEYEKENGIKNCWEYFFERINSKKIEDLCINDECRVVRDFNNPSFVPFCFRGIYKFGKIDIPTFSEKRKEIGEFIKNKIVVKKEIMSKINNFYDNNFKNYNVVSIHIRGTDRFTETTNLQLSNLENYLDILNKIQSKYDKIFVCSDSDESIKFLNEHYDNVVFYDSYRSSKHDSNPIHFSNGNYRTGEDVLIESILMSKTNHIILSDSNVTLMSLYYNSMIDFTYYEYEFLSRGKK